MQEQQKYLTEERYENMNRKLKAVSLVVFAIGLIIGGGLIGFGAYKSSEEKRTSQENQSAAYIEFQNSLNEIESKIAALNNEYDKKSMECDSLNKSDSDWYANYNQCSREVNAIKSQINELELDGFQLNHTDLGTFSDNISTGFYAPFYMIGAFVILASAMISLSIYLYTKRRAFLAHGVQSTLPVYQEAVDKAAPTVSKAVGDMADSVAEGIARGIKKGKNLEK